MEKKELRILIGVAGAGKTTYANQLVKEDRTFVKISRDDVRYMLRNEWYPGQELEDVVSAIVDASIKIALGKDWNVVLDNTHCRASILRETIDKWGKQANITLKVIGAELSLDKIREQNRQRASKAVPEDVIDRMHAAFTNVVHIKKDFQEQIDKLALDAPMEVTTFKQDDKLPTCIIVDIDGTVAHKGNRGPFDWAKVDEDTPDESVLHIIRMLSLETNVVFMSGRDECCREATLEWLHKHYDSDNDIELYMRGSGDYRKDSIVKKELFMEKIASKYYVEAIFDDRDQVVAMWRNELGLKCLQVDYGNF